jgi:hypothetical protein
MVIESQNIDRARGYDALLIDTRGKDFPGHSWITLL